MLLLACRRAKDRQFSGHPQAVLDVRGSQNPNHEVITDRAFGRLKGMEIPTDVSQGEWASKFKQLLADIETDL